MTGSYRLAGQIEAGNLAELYKATQESGGDVVVKLFHPKTSDPAYARALADTARVLNPLPHAGLVHYLEIGFVKQRLAVVREHVDGHTLGTALQRLNAKEVILQSSVALYLIIQLLEAVQQAHEAGVIHGAITPGNLLLSHEGLPSICDFGALQALMAVPELKRGFANRGRSAYRAPEVGKGEAPTAVSDVYSLGAIAYELLTLREAVVSGGGLSTRSGGLPPPSRLDRRINSRLDPIILRAVDPFPNRRFRSAGDFASALRNFFSASGGMPGQEDLRRFMRELVPNEVNLSVLGPVPFSEPFTLTPISGAEIEDMHAEPLEVSMVARPSFSRSLSQDEAIAETTESAPLFEEYKPSEWGAPEPTQLAPPAPVPAPAPASAPAPTSTHDAWNTQESTQLSAPEPQASEPAPAPAATLISAPKVEPSLEPTHVWEAPPGAAPAKPRKQLVPMGVASTAKEGTQVGRNPRLKWVEDFSEEKTRLADELQEPSAPPAGRGVAARAALPASQQPPARPAASLGRAVASEEPAARQSVFRDRPEIPMPPPTSEGVAVAREGRRLLTEERNLLAFDRRRQKALGVAVAIALVGLFAFGLAVWRLDAPVPVTQPKPPMDPRASAISGAVDQYAAQTQPTKPPPKADPPKSPPGPAEEFEEGGETPKPDANSAFVTLRTNTPARVFIDGVLQRRRAPLTKYPVKAGNRAFVLESLTTKQRVEFNMRFERGKNQVVEQNFVSPLRR
jgi:serine/threonine protein kinase